MGDEKRFIGFLVLTMLVVVLTPPLFQRLFGPPPKPPQAKAPQEQPADPKPAPEEKKPVTPDTPEQPAPPVAKAPAAPEVPEEEPPLESRYLGSIEKDSGYMMKVKLTNRGAAVDELSLPHFLNEKRTDTLQLMSTAGDEDASFLLGIKGLSRVLETRHWKILDDPGAPAVDDQESVRFQTRLPREGLTITKTYTLKKNTYVLGLDIEFNNTSDNEVNLAYRLGGPRGFVLEGAWYATKKTDAAIADGVGANLNRHTILATELVKGAKTIVELADVSNTIRRERWSLPPEWFDRFDLDQNGLLTGEEVGSAACHLAGGQQHRHMERPVRFAGVDGQFFCALVVLPAAKTLEDRWDAAAYPVLRPNSSELRKLVHGEKLDHPDRFDVSVEIESKNFELAPGESLQHAYTVYAGPRKESVLIASLGNTALAKSVLNYQGALFIFPEWLVSGAANLLLFLLQVFYGWVGNWGVAIIMLTVLVRMLMFPLSRKQAIAAVKMQALKPELDAIREKYKGDKEKLSRAQMELWRKHNVNPLGGCLPLVIQMPIFIGLWQGLQSTVDLRHANFLWIEDLSAPDGPSMVVFGHEIFHWGEHVFPLSWLFGPYFNLLPTILIALFLVQQKMFMPPRSDPPDPQVELQQKMMTYMMVFFGYIFWRLPSGLCLYYIASTLWGIAERKLLPKLQPTVAAAAPGPPPKAEAGPERKRVERDGKAARDGRDKRTEAQAPTILARLQEMLKKLIKTAEKR